MDESAGQSAGRTPTLGESRVGVDFNPGGNPDVDSIKRASARLIDLLHGLPADSGETARLKAVAMTEIEGAAHWAVKAAARSAAAKAGR